MHTLDDAAAGRAALRKASLRILPILAVSYGVAYMDRINLSFAALQMNRDLGFSATVYGLGAGLFFIPYALLEIPSNLLLVRFGARRWIARIMLTWGLLAMAMMLVRTTPQFYILRLLLGAAEAGFFPGVVYFLTQWFPSSARGRAISGFYVSIPLSSVVMGALAGVLLGLNGRLGLSGWQWLFLIEGAPAVVMGVVVAFALPATPGEAKWLSASEKAWLQTSLEREHADLPLPAEAGVWRLLRDPRILGLAFAGFCLMASGYAFALSAPSILRVETHLSIAGTGYLIAAGGLATAVSMVAIARLSDAAKERHLHVALPLILAAVAMLVIAVAPSPVAVMIGYVAWNAGQLGIQGTLWTIPGTFLTGRAAAAGIAMIGAISMIGAFLGPWIWGVVADHTRGSGLGLTALAAFPLAAAAVFILQRPRDGFAKASHATVE